MKPTMSKDGKLRYNVRVVHRIDRDWLIAWLCKKISRNEDELRDACEKISGDAFKLTDKSTKFKTASALLKQVKVDLIISGSDYADYWTDDVQAEDLRDFITTVAKREITRLFPDLK